MAVSTIKTIEKLDQEDQEKVSYFIQLLLKQTKYQTLKEDIALRREEIRRGETLTHEAMWDTVHV